MLLWSGRDTWVQHHIFQTVPVSSPCSSCRTSMSCLPRRIGTPAMTKTRVFKKNYSNFKFSLSLYWKESKCWTLFVRSVSVLFLLTNQLSEEFHTVRNKAGIKVTADISLLLKLWWWFYWYWFYFSIKSIITHSVWHNIHQQLESTDQSTVFKLQSDLQH